MASMHLPGLLGRIGIVNAMCLGFDLYFDDHFDSHLFRNVLFIWNSPFQTSSKLLFSTATVMRT